MIPGNVAKLLVVDSVLSSDGANGYGSIHIAPLPGGSVSAQIERVRIFDAPGNGVRVDSTNGAAQVELRDVTVHGSAGGSGIVAVSPTSGGAPAVIYADNVAATGNAGYGLRAVGGTAAIYLNRSTIMNNGDRHRRLQRRRGGLLFQQFVRGQRERRQSDLDHRAEVAP